MSEAYYDELERTVSSGTMTLRLASQPATTGPWSPQLQHGGPPNALAVAVAEQLVAAADRPDLVALRLAADFLGPVPVAHLTVSARLLRLARSAALAEVIVAAAGRDCLHCRVWFVRDADTSDVAPVTGPAVEPPVDAPPIDHRFPYGDSIEWRRIRGGLLEPGPAAAWARPRQPLLDGVAYGGLSRAVLIADSGNGVSAELDWTQWSFVNVDLDVHLARPLLGEWVLLDAATQLSPFGTGLARSTLSDVHGVVGAGLQTLVLARVSAPQPG